VSETESLSVIAENAPFLEEVETFLRSWQEEVLAEQLCKLVQDAGLELDPDFDPDNPGDTLEPQTAILRAAYEPITAQRLQLLITISTCLRGNLKSNMDGIILRLGIQNSGGPSAVVKATEEPRLH
jgi:hypothetical protein